MNTATMLSKLRSPVLHPQFLAPGLLLIVVGSLMLIAAPLLPEAREFLDFSVIGVLTGTLLLFKTRIGTFLYFSVLVGITLQRYERGLGLPTFSNFFDLALSMLILYSLISMGWEQVAYHFSRPEHGGHHPGTEGEHGHSGAGNP